MAFSLADIQKTVNLPSKYSEGDRLAIGELIVQQIKNRTRSGLSLNQKAFKYAKDSEFKGNNLEDTGDMLSTLEVISAPAGQVIVGYASDQLESRQAHGNTTGSYGKPSGNSSIAKPFVGITSDELELVLAQYGEPQTPEDQAKTELKEATLKNIFSNQGL